MSLTIEEVKRIADLARLDLSDDEKVGLTRQLGDILGYVERLSALDTTGVAATATVSAVGKEAMRDDSATNTPGNSELWSNAPALEGRQFRVPKIIE